MNHYDTSRSSKVNGKIPGSADADRSQPPPVRPFPEFLAA